MLSLFSHELDINTTIKIVGPRDHYIGNYIDTTSRAKGWEKGLSPFVLGPVDLYGDFKARNVENAWQYSKVYSFHVDNDGNPGDWYFDWAIRGWNKDFANRYPVGKGAKPLYSYWNGEKLDYVEARKTIYIPIYAKAVVQSYAYKRLEELYHSSKQIVLWDFDGYDFIKLGMSLKDVINNPIRKMGHSFVLAMLLTGAITISGDEVVFEA